MVEKEPFEVPLKIAVLMAGFEHPWFIAAGWAIDLYLGRITREHKDVEIAILRKDQLALRKHLRGWEFKKVKPSSEHLPKKAGRLEPWKEDEFLKLPTHEIHAYTRNTRTLAGHLHNSLGLTPLNQGHNTRNTPADPDQLEILLNESSGKNWVFRRNPAITRALSLTAMKSDAGVPFLSPEVVLLYKAKKPAAFDVKDFDNVIAFLEKERRIWLRQALEVCHPGHDWIERL